MSQNFDNSEQLARHIEKLRRDFGPDFLKALNDPTTIEIILNADGILWQERLGHEMVVIGKMEPHRAEAVMRTIATCLGSTITREHTNASNKDCRY